MYKNASIFPQDLVIYMVNHLVVVVTFLEFEILGLIKEAASRACAIPQSNAKRYSVYFILFGIGETLVIPISHYHCTTLESNIMPSHVTPSPPLNDDAYISEEDDDFNPEAIEVDDNASSDSASDEEATTTTQKISIARKQKSHRNESEAEDAGFENSGDEGIIRRGTRRRRKGLDDRSDSGGEGGFVKTRSMRAVA